MNTPWSNYLQVGLVHFMMYPETMAGEGPIVETVQQVASDPFFDVLEVTRMQDPAVRQQVRDIIDMAHMDVGFGAQPGILGNELNTAALDEDLRQRSVADIKASIDQAYEHGARLLAMIDGLGSWPGDDRKEQAIEQVTKSLREICQYAEDRAGDYSLTISLETFDRSIDKKSLLGPTRDAVAVAERVRETHSNFGLTIDLSHLPLLGETSEESLTLAKEMLIHTHVGNCLMRDSDHPAYGDKHPRFGAPGTENDVADLVEFLSVLQRIGFFDKELPTRKPLVTFEVRPMENESPDVLLANCRRVWQEAWAQL